MEEKGRKGRKGDEEGEGEGKGRGDAEMLLAEAEG